MHRIFCAINLGDDTKAALGDFVRLVKPRHEVMRPSWVDPSSFHLTLHFFGEMDDAGIAAAIAGLDGLVDKVTAPRLKAESLGYLPSGRVPRVLYLGFSMFPEKALDPIIAAARRLAEDIGAERETRPWLSFVPETFDLMESTLSPRGPTHETLRRFRFGK